MFHMLSSFDLQADTTVDEFRQAIAEFGAHMEKAELIQSIGPIGRRQRDTIMDTDDERDHEYFFVTSFRDRAQCDKAAMYIFRHEEPAESIHKTMYSQVRNPVFTCWEDI